MIEIHGESIFNKNKFIEIIRGENMTINEQANKEILKAKRAIVKAIDLLSEEPAYNNKSDIFHNCTVYAVNHLITASKTITEIQDN